MTDNPYGHIEFSDHYDDYHDNYIDPDHDLQPEEILEKYWGYTSFRPMQREIIDSVLRGNDTIGLLPTGGGKSITFQVPAMILDGITIVVTPLVSLMKDQVDSLKKRNIRAGYLHAGMTRTEASYLLERIHNNKIKILYLAPERLAIDSFLQSVRSWNVKMIVVDEAHCISQWGYDFRPSYLNISRLRQILPGVPVLALTASATPAVVDDIAQKLEFSDDYKRFSLSFKRNNISFLVRNTPDKFGKILEILRAIQGSTIIYTRSRRRTVELAENLKAHGFNALAYHAGLEPDDKAKRQDAWQNGTVPIMVATTAFGMGIDKANVRLVIHHDIPSSLEEYYQEAGRAGRDGEPAVAVMIVNDHDKSTLGRRLSTAYPDKDFIRRAYDEICRYTSLPMGEGFGAIFDFNPELMAQKYNIDHRKLLSAISILERAGYFVYSGPVQIDPQVHILLKRHELYDLEFSQKEEAVMEHLLRTYSGLFVDMVPFNEHTTAYACGIKAEEVIDILNQWRRAHIVQFIPRRNSPSLFFTTNRTTSDRLTFSPAIYDQRRALMNEQIDSVKQFAFTQSRCRCSVMLNYFGENAPECGKCDVCRSHRRNNMSAEKFEEYLENAFNTIAPESELDVRDIYARFPGQGDKIMEFIRAMVADGRLLCHDTLISRLK